MRQRHFLLVGLFIFSVGISALCQQRISAGEAKNHIGETAAVCGTVVGVHWATSSKGQPTFINLDKPYPNQVFTILIWGSDRPKFEDPEQKYSGKRVCVTGAITVFRDVPEIVAHDPSAVSVQ